jgi:hypothetical protein
VRDQAQALLRIAEGCMTPAVPLGAFHCIIERKKIVMDIPHTILVIALIIQMYNLGTIWFCQLAVYPLFARVGPAEYAGYHRFYTSHIMFQVIVPGFLSFVLPVVVLIWLPASVPVWMAVANVAMGIVGLAVTVGLEIPRHNKLDHGKDDRLIQELIAYNWPRTASITVSAALTLAMASAAFAPV